jgi:hypothetical protein
MKRCSPSRSTLRRSRPRKLAALLNMGTTVGSLSLLFWGPWLINSAMSSQITNRSDRYLEQLNRCNRQYDYTSLGFAHCLERSTVGN